MKFAGSRVTIYYELIKLLQYIMGKIGTGVW